MKTTTPKTYVLVYDVKLRRPGCVLLQAVMGGTVPRGIFFKLFDATDWLLAPTPGMTTYRTTLPELEAVARITERRKR